MHKGSFNYEHTKNYVGMIPIHDCLSPQSQHLKQGTLHYDLDARESSLELNFHPCYNLDLESGT